jgi:MFS family permease
VSGGGRLAAARRSFGSGPLAVRSFRLLAGGQFTSTIGDFCYAVALPWLVLSSHGGVVLLGTVLACYGVPRTVLIPAGGVLADKVWPRTRSCRRCSTASSSPRETRCPRRRCKPDRCSARR